MAFLTPDNIRTEYGLTIKEKILPAGLKANRKLSNGTGKVEYITIHNTDDIREAAGTNDAEQYARATHNGNMGGVAVHYYIDETDCWQTLRDDEVGYHAADGAYGPGNNTSISIEIIMDGSGSAADKGAEDRGARLAAILLHKHGLGIDRLTTHNRWYSKKYCPAYILPHWSAFKKKVETYLAEIKTPEKKPATASKKVLFRVQVGAFKNKLGATAYANKAEKAGFKGAFVTVASDGIHRVQIGAFSKKELATAYAKKAEKAGFKGAFVVEK